MNVRSLFQVQQSTCDLPTVRTTAITAIAARSSELPNHTQRAEIYLKLYSNLKDEFHAHRALSIAALGSHNRQLHEQDTCEAE
jgi:hypothetical protein